MGDSLEDELAVLRARAYGPDADIHQDPEAAARLRRLETEARADRLIEVPPPPPTPPPTPWAGPDSPAISGFAAVSGFPAVSPGAADPEPTVVADAGSAPHASRGPSEPSPDRETAPAGARRRRRSLVLAGLAGAAVAAAVAVPVTLWTASLPERPYAVLKPIDAPVDDVFFSPESGAQRFEDFLGIRVTTGAGGERTNCILIELDPDEESAFTGGTTRGACSAPGFEAVVDVSTREEGITDTVRAAVGDATGIRFAVRGDEVYVYLAEAPEDVSPS